MAGLTITTWMQMCSTQALNDNEASTNILPSFLYLPAPLLPELLLSNTDFLCLLTRAAKLGLNFDEKNEFLPYFRGRAPPPTSISVTVSQHFFLTTFQGDDALMQKNVFDVILLLCLDISYGRSCQSGTSFLCSDFNDPFQKKTAMCVWFSTTAVAQWQNTIDYDIWIGFLPCQISTGSSSIQTSPPSIAADMCSQL